MAVRRTLLPSSSSSAIQRSLINHSLHRTRNYSALRTAPYKNGGSSWILIYMLLILFYWHIGLKLYRHDLVQILACLPGFQHFLLCLLLWPNIYLSFEIIKYFIKFLKMRNSHVSNDCYSTLLLFYFSLLCFCSRMSNTLQLVLLPTRALFLSHTGTPNPLFLMARLISSLSHLTYEGCYKLMRIIKSYWKECFGPWICSCNEEIFWHFQHYKS